MKTMAQPSLFPVISFRVDFPSISLAEFLPKVINQFIDKNRAGNVWSN